MKKSSSTLVSDLNDAKLENDVGKILISFSLNIPHDLCTFNWVKCSIKIIAELSICSCK